MSAPSRGEPLPRSTLQPIVPLPPSTTSLLRSTLVIPSLPAALLELVQNALDAQASRIDVSFDLDRWTIKCEDNGVGIVRSQLGGVASERYLTSKTMPGDEAQQQGGETFGFRGEALASLADVALLELVSKARGAGKTISLVVRGGERLHEGVASTERPTEGTTVWVRDIFYKWPVRRKPLSTPSARNSLIASFRQSLTTLSLLHPLVSFTLVDSSATADASLGPKRLISVAKSTEGVLGRWRQLWGQAGTEKVWEFERIELQGAAQGMRAQGFVSLTAAHSKGNQFIFVNSRPLAPSPLHKLVNDRFSQSSFSRHAASHLVAPLSTSPSKRVASPTVTKASRKSPKKSAERFPIFVLNLVAPPGMVDVTLEPEKRVVEFEDRNRVHAFVQTIIDEFLRQHAYMSTPAPRQPLEVSPSVGLDSSNPRPLPSPNRSRASTPVAAEPPAKRQRLPNLAEADDDLRVTVQKRVVDKSQVVYAYPEQRASSAPPYALPQDADTPMSWTDPATLQTFLIDPRTGNSWQPQHSCCSRTLDNGVCGHQANSGDGYKTEERAVVVDRSALSRQKQEIEQPSWMVKTLSTWVNPVFPSSKPGIPSLTDSAHKLARANSTPTPLRSLNPPSRPISHPRPPGDTPAFSHSRLSTLSAFFSAPTAAAASSAGELPMDVRGAGQRFTKENLRKAQFVAQVDRKFLLVKMSGMVEGERGGGAEGEVETLVMVDQHAADERIRVERLMEKMCGRVARGEEVEVWSFAGDGEEKEKGQAVLVSRTEAVQIAESVEDFKRWGVGLQLPTVDHTLSTATPPPELGDYVQIHLTSVPLVVSDRLRVEPRLQQELVRSYLAQLAEQGAGGAAPRTNDGAAGEETSWKSVVRQCPPVLLDLINSKACRGAIMFNDELTTSQSTTLLARLAETSFPFQCAHGRPSLMPIVNLANPSGGPSCSSSTRTPTSADRNWRAGPSGAGATRGLDWSKLARVSAEGERSVS